MNLFSKKVSLPWNTTRNLLMSSELEHRLVRPIKSSNLRSQSLATSSGAAPVAINNGLEPFPAFDPNYVPQLKEGTNLGFNSSGFSLREMPKHRQTSASQGNTSMLLSTSDEGKRESESDTNSEGEFSLDSKFLKHRHSQASLGFDGAGNMNSDSEATPRQSWFTNMQSGSAEVKHETREKYRESSDGENVNDNEALCNTKTSYYPDVLGKVMKSTTGSVASSSGYYTPNKNPVAMGTNVGPLRVREASPVLDYPDDEEPFIGTPENTRVVPLYGFWGKAKLVDIEAPKKKENEKQS